MTVRGQMTEEGSRTASGSAQFRVSGYGTAQSYPVRTRDRLLQIVSGEIFRAYIGVSIQGDVIASGKLLDFFKRRELGRFGSDRGCLIAGALLDIVRTELSMLRRARKNHEQRLLFLIHLSARLRPDSMGGRITLGKGMENRNDCGRVQGV